MATHQLQNAVAPDYTRYPAATQDTISREEKAFLHDTPSPSPSLSPQRPSPHSRMVSSARGLLVALTCLLVLLSLTLALTDDLRPGGHDGGDRTTAQSISDESPKDDASTIHSLLDAVSPESLHELLHQYFPGRYQHGVWLSDRAAVEAVVAHPEDGPAVTSLVRMLRRDNTTSSPPLSSSEQPQPTTTTTPLPTTTTSATSNPGPVTSSPSPTVGNSPSSSTAAATTPDSRSSQPSSTSPPSTLSNQSSSRAPLIPTTSRRPQTNTFTSIVNGSPTVVTQTTFVDVVGGAEQSTIAASLQTNAAVAPAWKSQGIVDAAVAGAVLVGGVLFT